MTMATTSTTSPSRSLQCGLMSMCIIFIFTFVLETGIGADVDQGKRITVSDEDVSEGGAVTYDEKPEVERHNCTFFYNNRYPTLEDGLVNCSWYATKACCKRTEVASVFSAMDPLYKATKLCRNYINFLMCFFCSPDQYKFYTLKNRKAEVCSNYCESLYEECKTAGFNKTLIGEAYANGTAFCAAQNFLVSENADCFKFDPKVFGHSPRVCPMTLQLLVLVVCVCLRLCSVSVTFHA